MKNTMVFVLIAGVLACWLLLGYYVNPWLALFSFLAIILFLKILDRNR